MIGSERSVSSFSLGWRKVWVQAESGSRFTSHSAHVAKQTYTLPTFGIVWRAQLRFRKVGAVTLQSASLHSRHCGDSNHAESACAPIGSAALFCDGVRAEVAQSR